MILHWPQIVIIVICLLQLGIAMQRDELLNTLISSSIFIGLLYFGGFFTAGCMPTF